MGCSYFYVQLSTVHFSNLVVQLQHGQFGCQSSFIALWMYVQLSRASIKVSYSGVDIFVSLCSFSVIPQIDGHTSTKLQPFAVLPKGTRQNPPFCRFFSCEKCYRNITQNSPRPLGGHAAGGRKAGGGPDAAAVRGDRGGLGRLQDLSDGCGAHGVPKRRFQWELGENMFRFFPMFIYRI